MNIILIAINNSRRIYFNSSVGLGVIYEYLLSHGYKSKCINYFIDLSHENFFIECSGYVPEFTNLPAALTMLKNYRDKTPDLLKGVPGLKKIQLKNLRFLRKSIEKLEVKDNSIIGFSVLSLSFLYSVYSALLIRRKNPKVKIVFGNYHITLSQNVRDFILKSGIADVAVIGDGCEPMLKVITREVSNGIVKGEFRENIIWPLNYYASLDYTNNNYTLMTSVGCPFACYFCPCSRKHTMYNLQRFEEYVKELSKRIKVEAIHLSDDEINPSLNRAIQVCDTMRKIGIPWSCFLTPRNINKELAVCLKRSNCNRIFVGADSFCNARLKYINKPVTEEQNLEAIYTLAEQGLRLTVPLILGFPDEDKRERGHNIKLYREIKKRFGDQIYACFSIFKLYPGSYFYNNASRYGIRFSYWHEKYQRIIPELRDVIRATPERFYVPSTNRRKAIREMKKYNNYLSTIKSKVVYKEVHLNS